MVLPARASSVTLAWDLCPESMVSGYRVYYGMNPANLDRQIDAGNTGSKSIGGLLDGQSYYFSVCSYNPLGLESTPSSPINFVTPPPPSVLLSPVLDGAVVQVQSRLVLDVSIVSNSHSIDRVRYFTGSTLIGESMSSPFTLVWTPGTTGVFPVYAQLVFDGGSNIQSAPANVLVVNPPPAIALNNPKSGASFTAPATVAMGADVTANGHTINKVQFYNGSTLLGEDSSAPYTAAWANVAAGTYSVTARLVFDNSTTMDSAPVSVTVMNPPPVIALNSPASGASFTAPATVAMGADVTANGHTINKVQFYNGSTLLGEDSSAPYTAAWANVAAGTYSVTARLVFDNSTTMDSAPVSVTVVNPPPAIALNSPASGASFTVPATVAMGADVTANGHTINKVQFYNGSTLLGEDSSAPYTAAWANVAAGTYSVTARLVFDNSTTMDSAPVSVTVANPPPAIALNSPAGGASFTAPATVAMGADVTANGHTINKVQFYNGSTLLGEDSSAPYTAAWANVAAGTYSVTARLVFDNSTTMDSAPVSVTVIDSVPTVVLTSPTSGASYTAPGVFTVTAAITSSNQIISKVQFFANGTLIGEKSSAPYSVAWSGVSAGTWRLQAKAIYGAAKEVNSGVVNVSVGTLTSPWNTKDIGSTGLAGGAGVDVGALTVQGAGTINNSKDAFRYLYQTLSGDGEMTVRLSSIKNTGGAGSIGIMIRETLNSDSKHAFIGVSGSGAFRWEKRSLTGGNTSLNNFSTPTFPNAWVRLVRVGNTLSGYTSTDGVNWTLANNASVSMASNIYVGLAVASGSTTALNTAVFVSPQVVP